MCGSVCRYIFVRTGQFADKHAFACGIAGGRGCNFWGARSIFFFFAPQALRFRFTVVVEDLLYSSTGDMQYRNYPGESSNFPLLNIYLQILSGGQGGYSSGQLSQALLTYPAQSGSQCRAVHAIQHPVE